MLRFERRVTAALTTTPDPDQRAAVEEFVDGTLATMPEVLRSGVALGSIGLTVLSPFVALGGRSDATTGTERADGAGGDVAVERLGALRIGPIQQYFRLFRSLVVFAEHETAPEPST